MIYEMRFYNKKLDWTNENDLYVVVWETDDKKPVLNGNIRGKLLSCLGYGGKTYDIPEGIDTIGAGVFFKSEWDYFDCYIEKLIIPASVIKVEEGAFEFTYINKIQIHPNSPAGVVKNKGLYTKDGSTLLWALEANEKGEYKASKDVKRIGRAAVDVSRINTLILPSTVEEICYDEVYQYGELTIKAPVNSYAQTFAKKHGIPFEAIEE